jgi:hypothetical protein
MKKQDNAIGITKIYLVTNCYNNPNWVYIGKTKDSRKNPHQQTYGDQIEYTEIDEIKSLDKKDWKLSETYWIQQFKAWGFKVLNKNEGGGGVVNHLNESKIKISNSRKGKSFSEETKQKMSYKKIGQKRNEEIKNKISLSMKGKNTWSKDSMKGKNTWSTGGYHKKSVLQYDLKGNIIKEWNSITEAANALNIKKQGICDNLKNRCKTSGNYVWKYKND